MGLLDLFNDPYQPSASSATAGLLSPQDKLMALFQGLSSAGIHMAQPGLGRGQALAMGLGGFGQGMAQGNQQALQQRLIEQRLAEQQRKQLAADRFGTMLAGGANGPRTDGGGAGGLSAEQRGIMSSLAAVDPGAAATLYGKSMEFNKPKDQLQEINGQLYNVANPMKPVLVANAQRPQQNISQLIEERAKAPPELRGLYDAQIAKLNTEGGYRIGSDGGMSAVTGGPADPRQVGALEGAKAWAGVNPAIATANGSPFNLSPGQQRFAGQGGGAPRSMLELMPQSVAPPPAPQVQPSGATGAPPPLPPQLSGLPQVGGPKPIASVAPDEWKDVVQPGMSAATHQRNSRTGELRAIPDAEKGIERRDQANAGLADTERMIKSANELLDHPGRAMGTGITSISGYVPGTDAYGFRAKLETLKAQVFLPEVQKMVGMGALSDAEGKKITAAFATLDPGMKTKEFESSLRDAIHQMEAARARFVEKAGRGAASGAKPGGIKFLGFE